MISLCVPTMRPGGVDILAYSFDQLWDDDYELVLVDDCPGRVERGEVPAFLRSKGVKLGWYGKSKPKSYPETKCGIANAMNTALFHARGDYLVWTSDYTWLPNCWVKQWRTVREKYGDRFLVSGGGILYECPKPQAPGDVHTWQPREVRYARPVAPWVPWEWETFYVGMPTEFLCEINGVDERADHCHCWPVSSKMRQAAQLMDGDDTKYKLTVVPTVCAHIVDHRLWDEDERAPGGCGGEGLWKITHLQSVPNEPDWVVPSPNPFDVREERRKHMTC